MTFTILQIYLNQRMSDSSKSNLEKRNNENVSINLQLQNYGREIFN